MSNNIIDINSQVDHCQQTEDLLLLRNMGFNAVPKGRGKTPHCELVDGQYRWKQYRGKGSEAYIEKWTDKGTARKGICILTDDLVVIDADSEKLAQVLYVLEDKFDCHPALVGLTARGEHHYFKRPSELNIRNIGGAWLDVRTNGGQVCVSDCDQIARGLEDGWRSLGGVEALTYITKEFANALLEGNGLLSDDYIPTKPETVQTATLEEIKELLEYIDPDCGYSDWFTCIAGIYHSTDGSPSALELVDTWARGGEKYKEGEIATKWRTLERDVEDEAKLTINSVYALAKANGYVDAGGLTDEEKAELKAVFSKDGDADADADAGVVTDAVAPQKKFLVLAQAKHNLQQHGVGDDWVGRLLDWGVIAPVIERLVYVNGNFFNINEAGDLVKLEVSSFLLDLRSLCGAGINQDTVRKMIDVVHVTATEPEKIKFIKRYNDLVAKTLMLAVKQVNSASELCVSYDLFVKKVTINKVADTLHLVKPFSLNIFPSNVADCTIVEDYREHFKEIDFLLDMLVAARFAPNRRQSYCWLHAESSFGKTMLSNILASYGLVFETSSAEIKTLFTGGNVGGSAEDAARAWVLWVDEFRHVNNEIKLLDNSLTITQKFQVTKKVPVYLKMFSSADSVSSLAGITGVETQFANRFTYLRGNSAIDTREKWQEVGAYAYFEAIKKWVGSEIKRRALNYLALGVELANKTAMDDIESLKRSASIDRHFDNFEIAISDTAKFIFKLLRDLLTYSAQVGVIATSDVIYKNDPAVYAIPLAAHPVINRYCFTREFRGQDGLSLVVIHSKLVISELIRAISSDVTVKALLVKENEVLNEVYALARCSRRKTVRIAGVPNKALVINGFIN